MSPAMIMEKYGAATVFIEVGWKLFDPRSGLPVFQKVITRTVNGQRVKFPAFVELQNGRIVPWLVTDDENQSNFPIGSGMARGSGFVVTDNGFILTNRHVAANWMSQLAGFPLPFPSLLFFEGKSGSRQIDDPTGLDPWVPDSGYLFNVKQPKLLFDERVPLEGRNYRLDVTFPKNKDRTKATLVRTSDTHDVALMKIDFPGNLPKVDLIPDDYVVRTGEPVTILGYPGISDNVTVIFSSDDWFNPGVRQEIVPEPTVTHTGISKNISSQREVIEKDRIRFAGSSLGGSYYQLATSATGPGNSGGPVLNGDGQVVGIFAAGTTQIGTNVTFAVPIEYGKELLTNTDVFR
jgi:S1-C subfamily serine protease